MSDVARGSTPPDHRGPEAVSGLAKRQGERGLFCMACGGFRQPEPDGECPDCGRLLTSIPHLHR